MHWGPGARLAAPGDGGWGGPGVAGALGPCAAEPGGAGDPGAAATPPRPVLATVHGMQRAFVNVGLLLLNMLLVGSWKRWKQAPTAAPREDQLLLRVPWAPTRGSRARLSGLPGSVDRFHALRAQTPPAAPLWTPFDHCAEVRAPEPRENPPPRRVGDLQGPAANLTSAGRLCLHRAGGRGRSDTAGRASCPTPGDS